MESHYSVKAGTRTVKIQEIMHRPNSERKTRAFYEGSCHGAVVCAYSPQYAISFDGPIVHKTACSPGRKHDFNIYKTKHPTFPDGLRCGGEESQEKFRRDHLRHYGDTAYVAMGKAVPGLDYTTPFKRMPGRDPTPGQRAYNRAHCMVRIRVENGIRRVKVFRIMKERYRNRLEWYDHTTTSPAGWSTRPSC